MNRLIIIGASGHGKVVADIAKLNGYTDIVFIDDDESVKDCNGYPVIGKTDDIPDGDLFVAVGNPEARERIMEQYKGRYFPILIHPNATIAKGVNIGNGTVIMAGAVINPCTKIGEGCIVNTCSSVDHDCSIEDYVHVAVGAHVCGTVNVGKRTWIGAGSTIINNLRVCSDCLIGAGAVVTVDLKTSGKYVGVPAKEI